MAEFFGISIPFLGANKVNQASKEKNPDSDQKLEMALNKLSVFYSDKSDNDHDGKADHYNPDIVRIIKSGEHKDGIAMKFLSADMGKNNTSAYFRPWLDRNAFAGEPASEYERVKKQVGYGEDYSQMVVNKDMLEKSSVNMIAATLAHEFVHAEDYVNNKNWLSAKKNSLTEEYDATAEAAKFLMEEGTEEDKEVFKDKYSVDLSSGKLDKAGLSKVAVFYARQGLPLTSPGHEKTSKELNAGVFKYVMETFSAKQKKTVR